MEYGRTQSEPDADEAGNGQAALDDDVTEIRGSPVGRIGSFPLFSFQFFQQILYLIYITDATTLLYQCQGVPLCVGVTPGQNPRQQFPVFTNEIGAIGRGFIIRGCEVRHGSEPVPMVER